MHRVQWGLPRKAVFVLTPFGTQFSRKPCCSPTEVTWEKSKHLLLFLHNLALPDLLALTSPTGPHREVSPRHMAAALLKFVLHPLKTPKASSAMQSTLYSQPESVMEFYLLLCNLTLFSSTLMFLMCASGILTLLTFLPCDATSSMVWKL